ncbi:hypothetical protein [Fluviicola sp.]|uniref:hypothetical protein n=1 Tax=Fluviicola sp. TaxID=1917219 RepID=UPI0031D8AA03
MNHSLKTIQVVLLLLITTTAAFAQKAIRYKVTVPQMYVTKDYLSLATDNISNKGRYLIPDGFELILMQEDADNYVRSVFESVGIPVLGVTNSKYMASFAGAYEKAGGVDCEAASLLCSNGSQTANSGGSGVQELTTANRGCLSTEHQSSWYYLNVQTGGTLTMTISPSNSGDDYDFAIWGPFTAANAGANCPPTTAPIRCSWSAVTGNTGMMIPYTGQSSSFGCGFLGLFSCTGLITSTNNPADVSEGSGGDSWVSNLTTTANQVYILLVDNFNNSGQPYTMSFGGTSVLGCTPVVLPVELTAFSSKKTSKGNLLNWTTQTEQRSNYFTIDWTTDPASGNWQEVAHVAAQGFSQEIYNYNALHANPSPTAVNYYRLTSTDLDGTSKVYDSYIVSVNNAQEAKKVEKMYNLMGQEVNDSWQGVVIYYYSDGTTEKVYR